MIPKVFTQEINLEDSRKIILETGKLAKQADGSVVVSMGKCMLLATVVSSRTASPVDFLPLGWNDFAPAPLSQIVIIINRPLWTDL